VDGATQTGNLLLTTGWSTTGTVLLAGDRFSIGYDMYTLAENATAAGGDATLVLVRALRWSPVNLEPLELTLPRSRFVLVDTVSSNADTSGAKDVACVFDEDPKLFSAIAAFPEMPPGENLYVLGVGDEGRRLFQYGLSDPWVVSSGLYTSKLFDVSADGTAYWFAIDPSGGTLLIGRNPGPEWKVWRYAMSVSGDMTTVSDTGESFTGPAEFVAEGFVDPSGVHMFVISSSIMYHYVMSQPWKPETATLASGTLDLSSEVNANNPVVSPDGTKLYFMGGDGSGGDVPIVQYTMGTAWSLPTATRTGQKLLAANYIVGLAISEDGGQLIVAFGADGGGARDLRRYQFGTPWSVTTLSATGTPLDISAVVTDTALHLRMW
jgi:hypothetical protein